MELTVSITTRTIFTVVCLVLLHTISIQAEPCFYNTTSCTALNITSCFGAKITFSHASVLFANDSSSTKEVENKLAQWSLLQRVPECWAVIQPYLCSVYLPKCDAGEQKVELPNKELCERTREPCRVVQQFNGDWPDFLKCDAWFYAPGCGLTYFEQRDFNTTSTCAAPLIRTTDENSWYGDIKGCGIQCQNPLFTDAEHNAVHIVIVIAGSLCLISTLFTLLTFMIDWKVGRRYPAVILFFICGCFFLGSCGWMVQFIGDLRQDIICRADGTVRKGEPLIGSGESATCTIVFIVVYFFMMAGVVWFVMLAYSWDVTFKALGTVRDDLSKKTSYFHIISWCLPLVLTIVCLAISEIDGDSLSGICFVGYYDNTARAGFVLAPIGIVLILGMIFLIRGLRTLIRVKKDSPQVISDKATAKIRGTIFRLGIFTVLAFIFVLVTFIVHLYNFTHEQKWANSFQEYIRCEANVSLAKIRDNKTETSCEIEQRPSLAAAIIHIVTFFGAGVAMSSWSWTEASVDAWKRLFRQVCNKPEKKPEKIRQHRIMAKAYRKKRRKDLKKGRFSFSYGTDRDDPLGMKMDMNSVSSQSLSSGYAIAMKKMARRQARRMRGSVKKSTESELSSTASRVSRSESRRGSYESGTSQRNTEFEREFRQLERMKRRKKRRKKRRMNRVQPVLEPISSAMVAMHDRKSRRVRRTHSHNSNSSALSKASTQGIKVALEKPKTESYSLSSNVLSDSVTTNSSASEIPLPQNLTDFSVFSACPQDRGGNIELNSATLKGAKSSPSGSFRRGRRREYKLEMTETSFYQEDEDNIDMGGNQTIHTQDKTQESTERRNAMSEMNEFMENVRAASGNGRYSSERRNSGSLERRNSGQRDPFGSGRLGSGSGRASQSQGKELVPHGLPVASRVTVPDKIVAPGLDYSKKPGLRQWSGDYIVSGKTALLDSFSSTQGPLTGHKRQIGNNGRIDRSSDGVYVFHAGSCGNMKMLTKSEMKDNPFEIEKPQDGIEASRVGSGNSREGSGRTRDGSGKTMEGSGKTKEGSGKSREGSGKTREGSGNSNTSWSRHVQNQNQNVDILDVAEEHHRLKVKQPHRLADVLDVSAEHRHKLKPDIYRHKLKPSVDILDVAAEHKRLKPSPNIDFLDVTAEHRQLEARKTADILNLAAEPKSICMVDQYMKFNPSNFIPQHEFNHKMNVLNTCAEHKSNMNLNSGLNTSETCKNSNFNSDQKPVCCSGQLTDPSVSEERRRNLKRKHGQSSAGSRTSSRTSSGASSRTSSRTSQRSHFSQTGSESSSKQTGSAGSRQTGSAGSRQTGSAGSRQTGSARSKQTGSAGSQQTGSAGSKGSRTLQYDGIKVISETQSASKYDKFLASTVLPGVELNERILNLVDYEDDSYSDDSDDDMIYDEALLDTTSYDDDLTEVSSLPC